ncbi:cellulose binding domain-containing protein [Streptosporangium sp. NPDC048047]|uniref:cellulose binding domain-containing protein n=1 Tax=Streptosporangium sp. NPDC048047 TaxID=3155748 RepID=UPI0034321AC8
MRTISRRTLGARLAVAAAVAVPLAASAFAVATPAQAAAGCAVTYTTSDWDGGFTASIEVRNLGDAIDGWTLGFAFPDPGQKVTSGWSATYSQSGQNVTAKNVDYNGSIPTGGSVSLGFNGAFSGSNPKPAAFTLNGVTCTGSTTGPSPTPTATPTVTPTPPPAGGRNWPDRADGFAGTSGMGDNGTTGGAGGQTVNVSTLSDLIKYAGSAGPYVIKVTAPIKVTPYGKEISVASDKTIVGVGTSGQIVNGGFNLNNVHNVIIRNLQIRDTRMAEDDPDDKEFDYDGVQMDTSHHVWLDHNYIARMNDGLIDSRKDTTYLTVSWNVIAEGNKAFGIGWTDNVTARMTIHHNWIHDTNVRNPSTDNVAYAHLYNNYMQNVKGYGNYSRGRTRMVLENTYYDHVKDPYYRDDTAEIKESGSVCVSCTGQRETGGSAFDPKSFYSYTLDPTANVPSLLKTYAGPQANIG